MGPGASRLSRRSGGVPRPCSATRGGGSLPDSPPHRGESSAAAGGDVHDDRWKRGCVNVRKRGGCRKFRLLHENQSDASIRKEWNPGFRRYLAEVETLAKLHAKDAKNSATHWADEVRNVTCSHASASGAAFGTLSSQSPERANNTFPQRPPSLFAATIRSREKAMVDAPRYRAELPLSRR